MSTVEDFARVIRGQGNPQIERINQVIELTGASLRQQFGDEAFVPFLESPKPPRLLRIISAVNNALTNTYSPAFRLWPEEVLWLNKDMHQSMYELNLTEPDIENVFIVNRLKEAGADVKNSPYNPLVYQFQTEDPVQICLNSNFYRAISETELLKRVGTEVALTNNLILDCIFNSKIPKVIEYDENTANVLLPSLGKTLNEWKKDYPEADPKKLSNITQEIWSIMSNAEKVSVTVNGAILFFDAEVKLPNGEATSHTLAASDEMLDWQIVQYLAQKPLEEALSILIKDHPSAYIKTHVKPAYEQIVRKSQKKVSDAQKFANSIRIYSREELFHEYYTRNIFNRFLEAKKWNPGLTYPS